MRWFFGFVLLLIVLVGGVFGAGYLFLPTQFVVERAVDVQRPRATVFELISNLRTFNEIGPWRELDPQAEFVFSGPARGVGQKVEWRSAREALGDGWMEIVAIEPLKSVTLRIAADGEQPAASTFVLTPKPGVTEVVWRWTSSCDPDWRAVPCRYLNLLAEPGLGAEFERGLANLERAAEELPTMDFEGLTAEFVTAKPVNFAFVENTTAKDPAEITAAMQQAFGLVSEFLTVNQIAPAGPPITVTGAEEAGAYGFRAGVPFTGAAVVADPRVRIGQTPGGAAVRVTHVGAYDGLRDTYARFDAWMRAARVTPTGGPWEVYLDAGLPEEQRRTEIYFPIEASPKT